MGQPPTESIDCAVIGEFPTLFWLDRRDEITYPRDDDGNRFVRREPARDDLPPVNLNKYSAQLIDDGIGYLTAFYGFFFDGITSVLRTMLSAITAVFVGTPWVITMGAILAISYVMAGARITIFVGASLAYLALFGFWQTAMDTMSLVVAASLIWVLAVMPFLAWPYFLVNVALFLFQAVILLRRYPHSIWHLIASRFRPKSAPRPS